MRTLVFVYNADSGLFNTLADLAHKTLSPQTYSCALCALTHSPLGMRKEWKAFLESLGYSLEFLHRNELGKKYDIADVALPAIFSKNGPELAMLIPADQISACSSLAALKSLISEKIS